MAGERCTRVDIFDLVTRWEAIWGRHEASKEAVVEEWMRALSLFDRDVLSQALDKLRDGWEGQARPKVGHLKRQAFQLLRGDDRRAVQPDPCCCHSCGAHTWYAGYQRPTGEVIPRLRCLCTQGPGWETPEALTWVETDAVLLAAGYRPHPEAIHATS